VSILERWLESLVSTPGLTSLAGEEARRVHLEESLAAIGTVHEFEGPIIDVGSGGGAPGIPLAVQFPHREVTLLEANRRKCEFLEQPVDSWSVAVAKALAPPPVAAEWCLPLVAPDGAAILFVGPSADSGRVARVAGQLGAELEVSPPGLLVLCKLAPTPPGFPRRPGVARKRPLA
jgi:16S rRNA (guanine527-N7)-methyltransferase